MIDRQRLRGLERSVSRVFDRIARDPVRYALYAIAAGIFGGGTVFSLVEDSASMPDGWWWAWVSMSTVGYGDISPATSFMRFLAFFVIAMGILAVAIITGALAGRIAKHQIRGLLEAQETPEFHDDIEAVAQGMRDQADVLDALAPEIKRLHDEQSNDNQCWDRALHLVNRIEAKVGDPTDEAFDGGVLLCKRDVLGFCKQLKTLAIREGNQQGGKG